MSSNALFALASAVTLGTPADGALAAISRVDDVGGRYARHDVGCHQVRLFLVKNTASLNEAVTLGEAGTPIVFALEAFGIKDMAPLWDAPLERLAGRTVVASGQRRRDLAARLEFAGVDFRAMKDPLDAVRSLPAVAPCSPATSSWPTCCSAGRSGGRWSRPRPATPASCAASGSPRTGATRPAGAAGSTGAPGSSADAARGRSRP